METLYRKVAVSERFPENIEMLMTSHGWSLWNGDQFEDEDDKPISYINYWLEEIPDLTAQLKADKEELLEVLKIFIEQNTLTFTSHDYEFPEHVMKAKSLIQKHKQ